MRKRYLLIWTAAVLAADQLTKAWAVASLAEGNSRPLIGDLLQLTLVINRGAAFGILTDHYRLFIVTAALLLAGCLIYLGHSRRPTALTGTALALVVAGAVGNACDRLRLQGVVDFIHLTNFPVFNLADTAITTGVIGLLLAIRRHHTGGSGDGRNGRC